MTLRDGCRSTWREFMNPSPLLFFEAEIDIVTLPPKNALLS